MEEVKSEDADCFNSKKCPELGALCRRLKEPYRYFDARAWHDSNKSPQRYVIRFGNHSRYGYVKIQLTEDLPKCVAGIVRGGRDSFYSLNLIDHPVLGPVDLWQILFFANGTRYSTYPACFGLSPKGYAFNYIGGMAMTRISHLVFAESRVRYMGCVCTTNRFGSSKCDCPFERMEIPCSRSALLRALGDREILVSERGNSIYVPDCDLVALCREGSSNDIDCVGIFLGGDKYPFEGCGCRLPPSLARLKEMSFRIRLDEGAELASLIGDMSKMSVEEMDAHVDSLRKRIVVKPDFATLNLTKSTSWPMATRL